MSLRQIVFILLILLLAELYGCGKQDTDFSNEVLSIDKPIYLEYNINYKGQTYRIITVSSKPNKFKVYYAEYNNFGVESFKFTIYKNDPANLYTVMDFKNKISGIRFTKDDYNSYVKAENADKLDKLINMDLVRKTCTKLGTEKILNRQCEVYKYNDPKFDGKVFIYKDFVMLGADFGNGMATLVTTKFEPDSDIDDKVFIPPPDIEYRDGRELLKKLDENPVTDSLEDLSKDPIVFDNLFGFPGLESLHTIFVN